MGVFGLMLKLAKPNFGCFDQFGHHLAGCQILAWLAPPLGHLVHCGGQNLAWLGHGINQRVNQKHPIFHISNEVVRRDNTGATGRRTVINI